jgi:hypothetical protein
MYSEKLSILRAKESNETVNLGDSILNAEALYEDNGSGSVTETASSVIYTVLNAVGIFQEVKSVEIGDLALAGRFGQWKYFWTDDCVLRGYALAQ